MAGLDVLQSMLNPSYQADQATIDRQTAMANALMQNAMTPREGQMVSGHYIAPGLGGIDRLFAGMASNSMFNKANDERTALAQRYAGALQKALGSSPTEGQQAVQQAQTPAPNDGSQILNAPAGQMGDALAQVGAQANQPQPVQTTPQFNNQPQGNNFALNNLVKGSVIGQIGGDQAAGAYWKQYDPTDATKMAMAAGADPRLANQQALQKANYIAPISMRQGAALIDPLTNQITNFSPKMPDSSMPIIQNGQIVGVRPLSGAQDIAQNNARAAAAGAAGYPAAGNTKVGGAGSMPPGVPNTFTPTSKASIEAFGSGQTQQLATLDQNWKNLSEQNRQAQTTNSYLENIKNLAKTAATGPGADKKDFVNGLLSVAGVSDKATDAVTANDLLDKYQGQIIARLGQGGMGTDAARSLLASAYPGAHMNQGAINEAVDNLVGANEMVKAKASLLSPLAANRDPVGYQNKEVVFDQNADPRLWQYKKIAGTPEGKQFLQSVLKQDPQFLQKAQALHQIGAY